MSLDFHFMKAEYLRTRRGFTLVELLVTVSVIAILLALAVPSFKDAVLSSQLSAFANDFATSAHLARSEAIKRNAVVSLCVSSSGTSCGLGGWEQGWIVLSGATVIHSVQALPSVMKMTEASGISSLSFQPTGVGATQATLKVCRSNPVGPQERVINISATGRASITKTADGSCL